MRTILLIALSSLLLLGCCCSKDSTSPTRSLEGTWDLVGYSDHGASGTTTGTCTFLHDGTFDILGTVTYPGETTDSLSVSGTYRVVANIVTLTTSGGAGSWSMAFSGNEVVLSLIGSSPATTMTLRKRP